MAQSGWLVRQVCETHGSNIRTESALHVHVRSLNDALSAPREWPMQSQAVIHHSVEEYSNISNDKHVQYML